MGSIGASEILVILVVALLVLGPERLPESARQVGRFLGEIRRIGGGLQAELRDAIDAPAHVFDAPDAQQATQPPSAAASQAPAPGAPPAPGFGVEPPPPARPASPDLNGDANA